MAFRHCHLLQLLQFSTPSMVIDQWSRGGIFHSVQFPNNFNSNYLQSSHFLILGELIWSYRFLACVPQQMVEGARPNLRALFTSSTCSFWPCMGLWTSLNSLWWPMQELIKLFFKAWSLATTMWTILMGFIIFSLLKSEKQTTCEASVILSRQQSK